MTRVWLITGISRGLGRTLAEAALAAGQSQGVNEVFRPWTRIAGEGGVRIVVNRVNSR